MASARAPGLATVVLLGTMAVAAGVCEPHCAVPCSELNGHVEQECSTCTAASACHPGAPGFERDEPAHDASAGAFGPCLQESTRMTSDVDEDLPLFLRCKEMQCIRSAHRDAWGDAFLPRDEAATAAPRQLYEFGRLPGQPVSAIAEVDCAGASDVAAALAAMERSIAINSPLVLRGCGVGMPAMRRWLDIDYLRSRGQPAAWTFEPILDSSLYDASRPLPDELAEDLIWESPVSALLQRFQRRRHSVWASKGEKKAAVHLDTSDNLHVVVAGRKRFQLTAPRYARHMYVDFGDECPGVGGFGCDGLGCYAFVPWSAEHLDLHRYPRVADATVAEATLSAGDIVFIPALWFHCITHMPAAAPGAPRRTLALTFITANAEVRSRRHSLRPFASDIVEFAEKLRARENATCASSMQSHPSE